MSQLFDDSDSEIRIKTNNEYAKSYDTWRQKEELNKFKARYGEGALEVESDEEDSSEDDETAVELTEDVERDFYKTLALLKKKDPKIYDDKVVFFQEPTENKKTPAKADKKQSMSLKDYERQLLLEKGGIISDEESEEVKEKTMNWRMEEEHQLKKSFGVDEDSEEDVGTLLKAREETKEVKEKKEADYKAWLTGQEAKLKDKDIASLKHLKDYWNDPKLDKDEKFLRDCLLNSRYLDTENKEYIPTYDEIVQDLSEDEDELEKQEEFEHKYNFRFEEPDQEFIKRYPRTIEGSMRKEDNRRKLKRQEVKERKTKEKEEKMEELRKLRGLKKKEIEEKIEKLKEITGNQEIAFNDEDIDGDFDPEAHDRRMQALFNNDYYEEGPEEDIKPPIDLDDEDALELQPENYDNWTGKNEDDGDEVPHCEDDDFNMDADYDPKAVQKELVDSTRRKKKRKRKSKFVEMLAKGRPKFDPLNTNYEKYVDEYYKFECEDIIDDIPCKFKYRKVVPNNFGLSVEEILLANDRELNKWCSLKKAVSLRDDHVEKYEQIAYEKKGQNIQLKKKVIPSLFKEEEVEEEIKTKSEQNGVGKKKKNGTEKSDNNELLTKTEATQNASSCSEEQPKKKKKRKNIPSQEPVDDGNSKEDNDDQPKRKKKKKNVESEETCEIGSPEEKVSKKKNKKVNNEDIISTPLNGANMNEATMENSLCNEETISKKKKKHKKKNNGANTSTGSMNNKEEPSMRQNSGGEKKEKKASNEQKNSAMKRKHSESFNQQKSSKKFKKNKKEVDIGLSDSRIKAFGWNPKKFKNKVIYGNKDKNE